ncbi:hypothetical protein TMPK1_22720 [Rhodospirillales bacterium TMPK1]|uniref:Uncharacterized protein n=1 Tax=Roseiterribacter gracilis TaxID=2812848 RepID=A0A8S8XFY9_9PROT|nr:hypothetical protein TMPK1_22720 [Rhodospirillales bacterium TMPK1]
MLHHRRQRHGQRLGEFADGGGAAAQPLDHDPSRWIGKRLKDEIERGLIVKHSLKYQARPLAASQTSFPALSPRKFPTFRLVTVPGVCPVDSQ